MSALLEAIHDNNSIARGNAAELQRLADAFSATGNETVAARLDRIAETILSIAKHVDRAFSDDLTEKVNTAREISANLLVGVLSGIEIGNREATLRDGSKEGA